MRIAFASCVCATAGRRLGTFAFCFCTSDVASGRLLVALLRGTATAEFLSCVKKLSSYVSLKITLASLHEDKPRRNNAAASVCSLIHLFSSLTCTPPFLFTQTPFLFTHTPFSLHSYTFSAPMEAGGKLRLCSHHAMQQEKPCSMFHGRLGLFVVLFCVSRSQHQRCFTRH